MLLLQISQILHQECSSIIWRTDRRRLPSDRQRQPATEFNTGMNLQRFRLSDPFDLGHLRYAHIWNIAQSSRFFQHSLGKCNRGFIDRTRSQQYREQLGIAERGCPEAQHSFARSVLSGNVTQRETALAICSFLAKHEFPPKVRRKFLAISSSKCC